jgi:5-methylcytosine-specific restriction endonuclease McrA
MSQHAFGLNSLGLGTLGISSKKKKRKSLTPAQRIYIWERPNIYGRTCTICHRKITKLSDLELDHTRPYSKGGTKLALAHKDCNRLKSSGSLGKIQKTLGIKTTKRKTAKKTTKRKSINPFGIQPIKMPKFRF